MATFLHSEVRRLKQAVCGVLSSRRCYWLLHALSSQPPPRLTSLLASSRVFVAVQHLCAGITIGPRGAAQLAGALRVNKALERLNLEGDQTLELLDC
jgi:hypothetical protein